MGNVTAFTCLLATVSSACSTTATISRANGPAYEATIVGSDADSLRLESADGQLVLVPREDVVDIDHPGNVLLTTGAVLFGVGMLNVLGTYGKVIEPMSGQSQNQAAATAAVVTMLPGAVLTIVGAIIYGHSRKMADAFESATRTRLLAPRPPGPRQAEPPARPIPSENHP